MRNNSLIFAQKIASVIPPARAQISGERGIHGYAAFYATLRGVLIVAEIYGLPFDEEQWDSNFLCLHLFNCNACGKLCEIISNKGYAWNAALNEAYSLKQLIGQEIGIFHPDGSDELASGRIEQMSVESDSN